MKHQHLFISYARGDQDRVLPVVDAVRRELEFRAVPIDVWMDVSNLQPGESWDSVISDALESSVGFLFFVSPRSLQSEWIRRELQIATATTDRLLIPVILHRDLPQMPLQLQTRQWLDLSGRPTDEQIMSAAAQIADAVETYLRSTPTPSPAVAKEEAPEIAADLARELRSPTELGEDSTKSVGFRGSRAQRQGTRGVGALSHIRRRRARGLVASRRVSSVPFSEIHGSRIQGEIRCCLAQFRRLWRFTATVRCRGCW